MTTLSPMYPQGIVATVFLHGVINRPRDSGPAKLKWAISRRIRWGRWDGAWWTKYKGPLVEQARNRLKRHGGRRNKR